MEELFKFLNNEGQEKRDPSLSDRDYTAAMPTEARLPTLLGGILDGLDTYFYVSDMETDELLFINRRLMEDFGLDERALGQKCWKVLQTGQQGRCPFCQNQKLMGNPDAPYVWESFNSRTGRYYRNVDTTAKWADGRTVHIEHFTDITDVVEGRKYALDTRERLQIALDASNSGVWEIDFTNKTFAFDERCKKLMGFESDDGVLTFDRFFVQLGRVMPLKEGNPWLTMKNGAGDGDWPAFDSALSLPDGSTRYIRSFSKPIHEGGQVNRIIGMNMDITKNILLENELKAAKIAAEHKGRVDADERAQVMLDATPLASSFWDENGNMIDCNMEAVRLFGLEKKEDYTEHFYDLNPAFQPDGEPTADKAAREIAAAFKEGYRRFEWMYKTLDGGSLPVETTLVRVKWHGEYRLAAYSRDLREIKEMERARLEATEHGMEMELKAKAALAASEAKSQFLSNMSHEIRTPMNAIIGISDLLLSEPLNVKQRNYVSDIQTSAQALLAIVNDILDFSKIEAGKLQISPVDFNPTLLLINIESMFLLSARKKGLSFEMKILDTLPETIRADDIRLRQVLVNILDNAIKFTKRGGVKLIVRIEGGMLAFDVTDTGIGMKQEDMGKIFGEFDQLDMRANRNITGTGLGLPITSRLVAMMGGTLTVDSVYGEGTAFHIAIPLVLGDKDAVRDDGSGWVPITAKGVSILAVDDNEINLRVIAGLLEKSGIACDSATSGREAIEKIADKQYDLVFMDHMMPGMDGVETTGILRKTYGKDALIIVALTANAVDGARAQLMEAEMNDYLTKPIDKDKLNNVLIKWLPKEKVRAEGDAAPAYDPKLSCALNQVARINGVDVALALERLGGMQKMYEKVLGLFTKGLKKDMSELQAFLIGGDINNFAIKVHGVKGALRNLGIDGIAALAEKLEFLAKDGDETSLKAHLPDLIGALARLDEALSAIFPG